MRCGLAITGSLALQGDVITWVADHCRHHAFADKEGDPHSPWLFDTTPAAVVKGFWPAHTGWLFPLERTNVARFTPGLTYRSRYRTDQAPVSLWTIVSLLASAILGGLISEYERAA